MQKEKIPILPLITFYNSLGEGEVFNWWAEDEEAVSTMRTLSEKALKAFSTFSESRWALIPQEQLKKTPELTQSNLTILQMSEFAKKIKAALVLSGDCKVSLSPLIEKGYRLTLNLAVYRVKNGEKAAEVLRIFDLQSFEYEQLMMDGIEPSRSVFKMTMTDINEQLNVFHKKEKNSQVELVVSGFLKPQQLERLKSKIKNSMKGIKSFQQTSVENEQIHFWVDYAGIEDFGKSLGQLELKDFMTQVVSSDSKQVVYDVKAKEEGKAQ